MIMSTGVRDQRDICQLVWCFGAFDMYGMRLVQVCAAMASPG